jgi:hypothetical protein
MLTGGRRAQGLFQAGLDAKVSVVVLAAAIAPLSGGMLGIYCNAQ